MQNQIEPPVQKPLPLIQQRPEIYPTGIKRPNPLLEPSYNSKVMAKQLPKYEGLLNPQPIKIELRGRLPSYDVDKAIQKYPFSMDIPSIEELKEKRKLFKKIPEDTIFRRHIPKQVELDKFIDALKEKVIHDYNIPISVKALRAEYKRSPYFRDIVKYIRTGYCSYVGKAQRLFKMLCEDYILMDDILLKIRCQGESWKTNIGVMCSRKVCTYNFIPTSYTFIGRTFMCNVNVPYG